MFNFQALGAFLIVFLLQSFDLDSMHLYEVHPLKFVETLWPWI